MKWILLFIIFPAQIIWAQKDSYNADSVYTRQSLHQDFDLFFNTLLEVHPSAFAFTEKADLEELRKEIKESINTGTDMYFFKKISKVSPYIGCGHTVLRSSSNWSQFASKKGNLISLRIKLIDDEFYIWDQPYEDSIPLRGQKIISINGKSTKALLKDMQSIIAGDGYSKTLPNYKIQKAFRYYYAVCEGFSPIHEIHYYNEYNFRDSISLPARATLSKSEDKKRTFEQFDLIESGNMLNYYTLKTNKKVALIAIDAFKRKKFKSFYKTVFETISINQTTDLIIDLRNNGGGFFPHGNELLTYLIKEDIFFSFSRPKGKISKNKHLKMDFVSSLTKSLFKIIPDKNKDNNQRDYEIKFKPQKKNNYGGKIYVLTNNGSFSMSGYVASLLKNKANALMIGSETGGGENGSNAILMYKLKLPNTKHSVYLPYYYLNHNVNVKTYGTGVKPSIITNYTIQDLINERDLDLDLALSKIKKQ